MSRICFIIICLIQILNSNKSICEDYNKLLKTDEKSESFKCIKISALTTNLLKIEFSKEKQVFEKNTEFYNNDRDVKNNFSAFISKDTLFFNTDSIQLFCKIQESFENFNLNIKFLNNNIWKSVQFNNTDSIIVSLKHNRNVYDRGVKDGYLLFNLNEIQKSGKKNQSGFEFYFMNFGKNFKLALTNYFQLNGKMPMIPRWALGTWYSDYWKYSDEELKKVLNRFKEERIPVDVILLNEGWHKQDLDSTQWELNLFPQPEEFVSWVHDKGMKIGIKSHPGFIDEQDSLLQVLTSTIKNNKTRNESGLESISDFEQLIESLHFPLMEKGIDFWWINFKLPLPDQHVSQRIANQIFYKKSHSFSHPKRSLIYGRNEQSSINFSPITYDSNIYPEWEALKNEIVLSTEFKRLFQPYWTYNIGTFQGDQVSPELYIRFLQFSVMSPIARLHSDYGCQKPWEFDETIQSICQGFIKLRYRLLPYIYSSLWELSEKGIPLIRPIYLERPQDFNSYRFKRQYMFGDQFFVAPIDEAGDKGVATKIISFPEGAWIDIYTGNSVFGPKVVFFKATIDRMPLFAKSGAIIPMQPDMKYSNEKQIDPLILDIYTGANGSFQLYEDDGISFDYLEGENSKTVFEYSFSKESKEHDILIKGAKGKYKDMQSRRSYEIRLNGLKQPEEVLVNGIALPEKEWSNGTIAASGGWYYDTNYAWAVIKIPGQSIHNEILVKVRGQFEENDFRNLGEYENLLALAEHLTILTPIQVLPRNVLFSIKDLFSWAKKSRDMFLNNSQDSVQIKSEISILKRQIGHIADLAINAPQQVDWASKILETLFGLNTFAKIVNKKQAESDFQIEAMFTVGEHASDCNILCKLEFPINSFSLKNTGQDTQFSIKSEQPVLLNFPFVVGNKIPVEISEIKVNSEFQFNGKSVNYSYLFNIQQQYLQLFDLVGPFEKEMVKHDEHISENAINHLFNYGTQELKSKKWIWQFNENEDDKPEIDLIQSLSLNDNDIVYAATKIFSEKDQTVLLSFRSEEDCNIWLNGNKIYQHKVAGKHASYSEEISINLIQGQNTLLIKIISNEKKCKFSIRLSDRGGDSVGGLTNSYFLN